MAFGFVSWSFLLVCRAFGLCLRSLGLDFSLGLSFWIFALDLVLGLLSWSVAFNLSSLAFILGLWFLDFGLTL